MKHADAAALDKLEDLLQQLRALGVLNERSRGVFYWKSKPFLHFHDDPTGLYADLRTGADFERFEVNSSAQRRSLLSVNKGQLSSAR